MSDMASTAAEAIVQCQLDAYNARDIDAFMRFWSEDAKYFEHPATLLADGAAAIRERHLARFEDSILFGKLISRTTVGNKVVDREIVTRTFPEGPGTIDVVAIYDVDDDKIVNAWFIFGTPKIADAAGM